MSAWLQWLIDMIISAVLFINAALYLPQIYRIYRVREANAVSIWMLVGSVLLGICGVLYGHFHHQHLMLLGYALIFVTSLIVLVMTCYYRTKASLSLKKGELKVK
ncbi:MAG: PQ-loop repeat-containing protein [Coxiellaceae bacterium]|nr:PQ-loop repeat-containing protein [Coxiellaceae bacterium]